MRSTNLSILQYNVNKSREQVMGPLLADDRALEYDIIALQEPWKNPFQGTTYHPVRDRFDLLYMEDRRPRVCFFVNKRLSGQWIHTHHAPDYSTLELKIRDCDPRGYRTVHIHNIYNPSPTRDCPQGTLPTLRGVLSREMDGEHIVLGDFNLHHPLWGGIEQRPPHREADYLLSVVEEHQLNLILPPGTRTRQEQGHNTTIDLVFATQWLADRIISCGLADEQLDHDSDHLPISTIIQVSTAERQSPSKRRWDLMDKDALRRKIEEQLPTPRVPTTMGEIDQLVEEVADTLTGAIEQTVPTSRPSPRSIPGWNPEIKEAQMEARRLRRQDQAARTPESWEAYRAARNLKGRLIKKALRKAHRDRVQEATSSLEGLWRTARWAKNRGAQPATTPPIRRPDGEMERDPERKAKLLQEAFFPTPPEAELSDLEGFAYQEPHTFPCITQNEIERAIRSTSPKKAPGPDGIPNHVLQELSPILAPVLCPLYNACLNQGYCPIHFKRSITVTLKKPGKEDYTSVKSYRPVALLNTLGKIMEAILARRISYIAEKYSLLPSMHTGGRRASSTEQAIHLLLERIYAGWTGPGTPKVATILSLDVSGAFDNVSHARLIHNLRKRRIDHKAVRWVESFLQQRSTAIRLDEHTTEMIGIQTGIPQGSPLSPVLYLFYNADLIEECQDEQLRTWTVGYIDDVSIITVGESTESNCRRLATVHERCNRWEAQHASRFNLSKHNLIHMVRRGRARDMEHQLELPGTDPIRDHLKRSGS